MSSIKGGQIAAEWLQKGQKLILRVPTKAIKVDFLRSRESAGVSFSTGKFPLNYRAFFEIKGLFVEAGVPQYHRVQVWIKKTERLSRQVGQSASFRQFIKRNSIR